MVDRQADHLPSYRASSVIVPAQHAARVRRTIQSASMSIRRPASTSHEREFYQSSWHVHSVLVLATVVLIMFSSLQLHSRARAKGLWTTARFEAHSFSSAARCLPR